MSIEEFESDDFEIENMFQKKSKRKNSKRKGKTGELELVKIFNDRFKINSFSRVVGSGNRWSQVAYVSKDYIGDIVTPDNFKFCIECKFGYKKDDILTSTLNGNNKELNNFLNQSEKDAARVSKEPMLCYRPENKPWICFIKYDLNNEIYLKYNNWFGYNFKIVLELDNNFFFK